jgi:hypothetical protein
MFAIAGIARRTRSASAAAVAGFRSITRAVPRLARMILANPPGLPADLAFRFHALIFA